jgi:Gpi18-like mannosyltransferase
MTDAQRPASALVFLPQGNRMIPAIAVVGIGLLLLPLFHGAQGLTRDIVLLAYAIFFAGVLVVLFRDIHLHPPRDVVLEHGTLAAVLCLALTVRLLAAQSPGHGFDMHVNIGWAYSATQLGFARSYVEQLNDNLLPNYPPPILMAFWLAGKVYALGVSGNIDPMSPSFSVAVRLPAIAADMATCIVLTRIARDTGAPRVGAWIALAYALHPVSIYNSSVWGQTDGIYALWMLLALHALARGRWAMVGVWTATALLTKPQAVTLVPVVAVIMLKNARHAVPFAAGAAIACAAILLPVVLGGALHAVVAVLGNIVSGYFNAANLDLHNFWAAFHRTANAVSTGAYNFWAIFHRTARQSDTELALGVIPFRTVGLLLAALATTLSLWRLRRSLLAPRSAPERQLAVLLAGALTVSAFFIFATAMHERYQFAFVVLALPVAMYSLAGGLLYATTSGLILLNVLGAMPFGSLDAAMFRAIPALPKAIGVLQVAIFCLTVAKAPQLVQVADHPSHRQRGDQRGRRKAEFPGRSGL